ncbi:MAG: ATP-binding protein, partial [Hyphomicrobiaceae bacterium]|nr:ATP-binding protein [Hyphomicrobiaceae bacterium]
RLLIVDPSDVAFPPSLNLFDVHSDRLANYDQRDREQVLAGIIEIYDYIFGGLLGAELTQKQAMVFRFLAQLMLSIPGATIHTLRQLLEDAAPYADAINALPETARGFFENHFFGKDYRATREQVLRRLYGVLQNPSFERMFAQPENRLDLFDTLNSGGIVLVNTAKDFLKSEASSIFGRYIIALTLKAAFERATLAPDRRRPTYLWIDEAAEYFDDNIDNLLIQARKFRLGLVMAHQYLGQLSRNLPASLMTNTAIKLAGGVSDRDARTLAPEMRTTPEFLNSMLKERDVTHFAAFVRNHTPQAMAMTVPFGTAERMDRMSDESFERLLAMSRQRLSSLTVLKTDSDGLQDAIKPAASDRTPPPHESSAAPSNADDPFSDPY